MTDKRSGVLIDANFHTVVISKRALARIYPERTGMEDERVTCPPDGTILQDRRNQTYLRSDTIMQSLTQLKMPIGLVAEIGPASGSW